MLLSSVNFVAKPKVGKSKDNTEKEVADIKNDDSMVCESCKKEEEEENTIFRFPTSSSSSSCNTSGYSSDNFDFRQYPGTRVTIATGDALCLSVEQFYYTIALRDESKSDCTCIFRKKVLESKSLPNGFVETAVFALDCDQDFYLTVSEHKDLELNYYTYDPSVDQYDERVFMVYHTDVGHSIIQPSLHKNTYLYHIDQSLSVQKFDLNWRCPEQYFFHFNAVPERNSGRKTSAKICNHQHAILDASESNNDIESTTDSEKKVCSLAKSTNAELLKQIPKRVKLPLESKKPCKKRLLSDLFFGCFSAKSHQLRNGTTTEV